MGLEPNQKIVWEAAYSPFGDATLIVNRVENNIRFPGQYFDKETNLHYNYFRYYDPSTGRYLRADPIGVIGDFSDPQLNISYEMGIVGLPDVQAINHLYGYANQNPVNYVDPEGLYWNLVWQAGKWYQRWRGKGKKTKKPKHPKAGQWYCSCNLRGECPGDCPDIATGSGNSRQQAQANAKKNVPAQCRKYVGHCDCGLIGR